MLNPKKILYVGNKLSKHGNTITTIETLTSLLREEGYIVKTTSSKNNKVLRLLDMLLSVVANYKQLDFILIDTYSTQNFYYAIAVGNLARLLRVTYIPVLHGGNLPDRLIKNPFQSRKLFGSAYYNIAPSLYLKEAFNKNGYNNVVYIPNTIELRNYNFKLREQLTLKLLWVRSFNEIYNPELALKIVENLILEGYHPTLCMVGPEKDGSLEKCKSIAAQKNLPITFTGKLSKEKWIEKATNYDIFINTTNFDNTPVSIIEAMALGLPVISTNVGGIPYLIENQKEGILVPPDDSGAFVVAILRLIENPSLAKKIANKARKKVETFDWNVVKKQWFQLLNH